MVSNTSYEFATLLGDTRDTESIKRVLINQLSAYGYDNFAYALVPLRADASLGEYVSLNTLPNEWVDFYSENNLHVDDSLVHHCLKGQVPKCWSEAWKAHDRGLLNSGQARAAEYAREWGIKVGVTVPLQRIGNYRAGISLVRDHTSKAEEHDKDFLQHQRSLIELLHVFHAFFDKRSWAHENYNPTQREIEVLQWIASGLKYKQIAYKMKTAESTVEKQILSARRRMNALTPTEAAVKAMTLGLLD